MACATIALHKTYDFHLDCFEGAVSAGIVLTDVSSAGGVLLIAVGGTVSIVAVG